MTIQERAELLKSLSERCKAQRDAAKQEMLWHSWSESLTKEAKKLEAPLGFLQWAKSYSGLTISIATGGDFEKATTALLSLQATLSTDPAALLESQRNAVSNAVSLVNSLAESLVTRAQEVWKDLIGSIAWETAELWAAFRQHPEHSAAVQKAEALDQAWRRLTSQSYLVGSVARDEFESVVEKRRTLSLPPIADERIRSFILGAQNGVSLEALDEHVHEWLRDNGLLGSYVISRR